MDTANKLNDDQLNEVTGGMVLDATGWQGECDPTRPWEVIHNNTGECLSRWRTRDEACYAAKQYKSGSSYDTQICSREQVEYLRAHPQIIGR